jgi:hypothetical protein
MKSCGESTGGQGNDRHEGDDVAAGRRNQIIWKTWCAVVAVHHTTTSRRARTFTERSMQTQNEISQGTQEQTLVRTDEGDIRKHAT